MKYTVGQYVYTDKQINGWWDYSMRNHIPANSCGIVDGVANWLSQDNEVIYAIRFPKFPELQHVLIVESYLKLG
jgi:hypothetical protein